MTAKLTGMLKREVVIGTVAHTVMLDEHGLKLTRKGKRKGLLLRWQDLVSGEAALAVALNASLSLESASRRRNPNGTNRGARTVSATVRGKRKVSH